MKSLAVCVKHLGALVLIVLVAACASTPNTGTVTDPSANTNKLAPPSYESVALLPEPSKTQSALIGAEAALDAAQYELAQQFLLLTSLANRSSELQTRTLRAGAEIIRHSLNPNAVAGWYEAQQLTAELNAQPATMLAMETNLAFRQEDYYQAAATGLKLALLETSDIGSAQLWQALRALPLSRIQQLASELPSQQIDKAWLELAAIYADNGGGLQRQAQAIASWQGVQPNHPAQTQILFSAKAIKSQASAIGASAAIAIPLSGRLRSAGLAVRDAIIAAHLRRPQFSRIAFIDSTRYESSAELANAINQLNPSVVIGPIDKTRAQQLASEPLLLAPVIALNTFEATPTLQPGYRLGLNIEDEAKYLASISAPHNTNALIIAADNSLAQRAASAFNTQWAEREESAITQISLGTKADYSKNIAAGLLLNEFESRRTKIENAFGETLEATPRRRQDVDVIYLSASASQARAVNPLIAYHFAGDLPILAPSIIFDGNSNSVANRDLTDIVFADTAWAIIDSPEKDSLTLHSTAGGARSKNLHALAFDAYFLAAQINIFDKTIINSFNGRSGELLLKPDGSSKRIPKTARITSKGLTPLNVEQLQQL